MTIEIGSFEAKAQLSKLLREVQAGKRYTITVRGKPVAGLTSSDHDEQASARQAIDDLRGMEKVKGQDPDEIASWIAEGRR